MKPLLPIILLLCLVGSPARGQEKRHPAWFNFGLGLGMVHFSCATCDRRRALGSDRTLLGGWSITLGGGVALSRRTRLGLVYDGWLNGLKHDSLPTLGVLNLIASYSFRPDGGPFIEGGFGLSSYDLAQGKGDPIEPINDQVAAFATGSGSSVSLGVGYQRRGLRARIAYLLGAQRRIQAPDAGYVATGWKESMLLLVVEGGTP